MLLALFHFVSLSCLSFSLLHLEGYRVRLNNQPVTGMLRYFESNSVLFSDGLDLFSMIPRRMLHNLI